MFEVEEVVQLQVEVPTALYRICQFEAPPPTQSLCEGGVAFYKPKDGSGVTDEWLAQNIAPNISVVFGAGVGAILGRVLLYCCLDEGLDDRVPGDISRRVLDKWSGCEQFSQFPNNGNPIEKVVVFPERYNGRITLDYVPSADTIFRDENGEERPVGGGSNVGPRETVEAFARNNATWRAAMYARVASTDSKVTEMQNTHAAELAELKKQNRCLIRMVRILMYSPAIRIARGNGRIRRVATAATAVELAEEEGVYDGISGGDPRPATLSDNPKNLEVLWSEWKNGLGGSKPARSFTAAERGRKKVKYKYHDRKVIWGCMERLTTAGSSKQEAIQRIKEVYGNLPITRLVKAMRQHEKNGGHARLRA